LPVPITPDTSLPKILISEIYLGLKNPKTKYIELHNPNDQEIVFNDDNFQLKFIDSENQTITKNIQWIKNKISSKGYFIFSLTQNIDDLLADATFLDLPENIKTIIILDGQNNIKDQLTINKNLKNNQSMKRDIENDTKIFLQSFILTPTNSLNEKKIYDFQEPETILEKFPDMTTSSTTAFFSLSSNKQNVNFQYSLDDQEWENGTSIKEYLQLKLGKHVLKVRAIDEFNNIDTSPIVFQWQIIKEVLPLLITKIQTASEKNDNDEYIELYNPNDEPIDLSDYSIQKKSNDLIDEKKLIKSIPSFGYYLIVNTEANEILYYLADLKYSNFSLEENNTIYLIKDKKETTDILDDFDTIDTIEFNDSFEKKERQVDNLQKGQVLERKQGGFEITNISNPINSKNENGPTYLNGEMTTNTVLSIENNPYIIEDSFTIPEGKILTINSGVVIWPKSKSVFNANLIVKGTLIINGTKENPVKFTSLNKEPQRADYGQALSIKKTSKNSILDNVIFEYGDMMMVYIIPMVSVQGTDVKISNVIFRHAEDLALSLIDSNSLIENVLFENNRMTALSIQKGQPEIKNCQFKNNYIGVKINNHSKAIFTNNLFTNNQIPLYMDSTNEIDLKEDNQILNNSINKILFFSEPFPKEIIIPSPGINDLPY
jgi:hypothetical protein